MNNTLAYLTAALVAGLLSGCPSSTPLVDAGAEDGAEGGACYDNGTCNAGVSCVADVCTAETANTGDEGGACFANGTCNGDLACVANVCQTSGGDGDGDGGTEPGRGEEGGVCYDNGTCNAGLSCVADVCVAENAGPGEEGGACFANGTCNGDLQCVDDVCVGMAGGPGEQGGPCFGNGTCNGDLECVDDVCVADAPAETGELGGDCYANGTCNAGLTCDEATNTCADVPVPPEVTAFEADPMEIYEGESTTLTWTSTGATECSIAPDVGTVTDSGTQSVEPAEDTTYTVTCTNEDGSDEATVDVTVIPAPLVVFMADQANIDFGETVSLTWTSTDAVSCEVSDGTETTALPDVAGSQDFAPEVDTTYTLTCTNPAGSATAEVTITVNPPVTIVTLTVDDGAPEDASILYGDEATIAWEVINATACTIDLDGAGPGLPQPVLATASITTGAATADVDVVLTCSGVAGPAVAEFTIPVADPVVFSLSGPTDVSYLQGVDLTVTTSAAATCTVTHVDGDVVFGPEEVFPSTVFTIDVQSELPPAQTSYSLACSHSDQMAAELSMSVTEAVHTGDLVITSLAELEVVESINRVTGDVLVLNTPLVDLTLPRLLSVGGWLRIGGNDSMTNVDLARLETARQIGVSGDALQSLLMPALVSVGEAGTGGLYVEGAPLLATFDMSSLGYASTLGLGPFDFGCQDITFPALQVSNQVIVVFMGLANSPVETFPALTSVTENLIISDVNWTSAELAALDGQLQTLPTGMSPPFLTSNLGASTDCP